MNSYKDNLMTRALTTKMANAAWMQYVIEHKAYLISTGRVVAIPDEKYAKYKKRPMALLQAMGVPQLLVYPTLIINELHFVQEIPMDKTHLVIPEEDEFERIRVGFTTSAH